MKKLFLIAAASLLTTFACAYSHADEDFDYVASNYDENEFIESSLSDYDYDDDADLNASEFNVDDFDTDLNESDMYLVDEEFADNNDSDNNVSYQYFPSFDEYDFLAEAYLREALESDEYLNTIINYHYENKIYPIRVIRNPNERFLFSELAFFKTPEISQTIVLADLPLFLASHLEDQFLDVCMSEDCDVDLRSYESIVEIYGDLHPVEIGVNAKAFDANIRNLYYPNDKVKNEVFYYFLDDTYYKVRFIHNPKKQMCKSFYSNYIEGKKIDFSLSWNEKYGVVTDFKIPQKYIDYWIKATGASWWDKHFNFRVENGTYCIYQTKDAGLFTTSVWEWAYSPKFHVMRHLVVQR